VNDRTDEFPTVEEITRALALGVREALRKHALHGVPAAIWRDGKVVLVPAQELLDSPGFQGLDSPAP
jgi:hypothetical protein